MTGTKAITSASVAPHAYTRRDFLKDVGKATLFTGAMSVLPFITAERANATPLESLTDITNRRNNDPWVLVRKPGTRVRPLVIIFLSGGPNQKIFDPKPLAPENFRGLYETINTSVPGIQLSEVLPKTANNIDSFRLIRCMQARNLDHAQGAALSATGNHRVVGSNPTDQRAEPFYDAGHIKLAEHYFRRTLGCVYLNSFSLEPLGGFQPHHRAVSYVQYDANNNHIYPSPIRPGSNPERAREVLNLRNAFERGSNPDIYGTAGRNVDEIYANVENILGENFPRAFNSDVPDFIRKQVGYGPLANAAIVASNLIQAGAPLVTIDSGNWDTHENEASIIKDDVNYRMNGETVVGPGLGFALDNAINYLRETVGNQAVICAFGEFGRTPLINGRAGTDHGTVYSMLFTGAGVSTGVTGETDPRGERIISRERYNEETALEAALNLAGYMRVKLIGNSVIPPNPECFPTQNWIN